MRNDNVVEFNAKDYQISDKRYYNNISKIKKYKRKKKIKDFINKYDKVIAIVLTLAILFTALGGIIGLGLLLEVMI